MCSDLHAHAHAAPADPPMLPVILAAAVAAYLEAEARGAVPGVRRLPWLPAIPSSFKDPQAEPWPLDWFGWHDVERPR
jgi:hypothetical protein